jgi:hypothetical protein
MSTHDADSSGAVENAQRTGRAHDLAPVLESLALDLADARRACATLKRENAKLRAHLLRLDASAAIDDTETVRSPFQSTRAPGGPLRCRQCGLTLHGAVAQHDQTLLLASVCPRCDGPLARDAASGERSAELFGDPSIYLG